MGTKKNIDRLFQEKFKDFEVAPNDAVWERISESLPKKKKKRRVVPLWWKFGGVAAALILLFTVGNFIFNYNDDNSDTPSVVDIDGKEDSIKKETDNSSIDNQIEITDNNLDSPRYVNSNKDKKSEPVNNDEANDENSENKERFNQLKSLNKNQSNALVNSSEDVEKNKTSEKRNSLNNPTTANNKKDNVAGNLNSDHELLDKTKINSVIENNKKGSTVAENSNSKDSSNSSDLENTNKTSTNELNKSISDNSVTASLLQDENKENIEDAIAAQEHTDEKEKEDEQNRWSIAPNVAPVYFSSLGEGSSLDGQFNNNSKSGDINMSYGITASYSVSRKLKVRAGVNRVNLNQTTNDVLTFSSNEFAARLTNNSSNSNVGNRNINSKNNVVFMSVNMLNNTTTPEVFNTKTVGSLDQRFGFIEVPLELEYSLLDKKFGVNVIGGFSTFFLNQNEIYADIDGTSTLIGEANNINSTSFSANFGLGLDYELSKQWNINLEPQFKYQINTFNNTSGDFRPFFIGVYTGLSFKF